MDDHRALLLLLSLICFLSVTSPHFLSLANMTTILKGATLNAIVAIGFTMVFILGQLDLSIGAVATLSGLLTIGLQPQLGWPGAVLLALGSGSLLGLLNGLVVAKAKVNSFIVTLGTMTITTGLMHLYSKGGSKAIVDFRAGDFLEHAFIPLLPPMVIICLFLVLGTSLFLNRTTVGRSFYMVGGNPEAAWLAGLNRDRTLVAGFVLSGLFSSLGGVVFSASLSSMTSATVLGTRILMTVLAAVIIGGALMSGGKGSVLKSYFAVLMLTTLFNGMGCFGFGFEVQIFANGIVLAIVVLYEAYILHKQALLKGQRPDLVLESEVERPEEEEEEDEEEEEMNSKDRFALVCATLVAMVAVTGIVAIFAMFFIHANRSSTPAPMSLSVEKDRIQQDVFSMRGTDGQPLILSANESTILPPRPLDPKSLPETEKGHWWDIEYAGWQVDKAVMPESPREDSGGKKVVLLKAGDHPYWTAYVHGFETMAKAYGIRIKIFNSNWNMDLQAQQTDQAINERPDMILFAPVDATACTPLLRRIHSAGIPCIASNTIPCDEAMRYCLAWTGPDDWGQFRMLARVFADAMDKQGGYAIVRHMPGSSPFFARTYAPITELREYAPDMRLLAMDTANLEAERTMQLVSAWLTKYGDKLKGLVLAGDGFSMTGTLEAVKSAGRKDMVIVAAGNSKTGMDSVKAGDALAITYQSAEGDGALALHTAARWFQGETLDPVNYLPKHIITQSDVDDYMPAQW